MTRDDATELLNTILNDPVLRARAIVASRQLGACPMRSESHLNTHEDSRVVAVLNVFLPSIAELVQGLTPAPAEPPIADLAPAAPGDAGTPRPNPLPDTDPIVPGDRHVH